MSANVPDTKAAPSHGVSSVGAQVNGGGNDHVSQLCSQCNAPRKSNQPYCGDCGWVFADGPEVASSGSAPTKAAAPSAKLKGRYQISQLLTERGEVTRYKGLDYGAGGKQPVPVVIVRGPNLANADPIMSAEVVDDDDAVDSEIMPGFEEPATLTGAADMLFPWPSVAWERSILEKAAHPAVPTIVDSFVEDGMDHLIIEVPTGQVLWDAWDESNNHKRFGWLIQVAEGLHQIHLAGALFEGMRPDIVTIDASGQARFNDLADLLPLPLPPNPPLRATLYTAPELILSPENADARANLYSFGAMVFSLFLGRELVEKDFERPNVPKPFLPQYPDVHPALGRLLSKTFIRELDYRFPSDEAMKTDATGVSELIKTLAACQSTLDNCHLEIAAWTTTGMIRTGNEDAFALIHAMESCQDDMGESALVLVADGMGGYDAGEIASALAIRTLRTLMLKHKMFSALAGGSPDDQEPFDLEVCKKLIYDALKETNKEVFTAPQRGIGKRGMGCTAEVVYVNGQHVVVGHVGDSRCYHLNQGNMIQVTRDQTLVNRLIELGQIKPEEADTHPRRSELQQAIGGRATVEPVIYHGDLHSGDWILVCTDGLTNHINGEELREMLHREAGSAEIAARRLVNFVNIRGATDNSTVVVVRAT